MNLLIRNVKNLFLFCLLSVLFACPAYAGGSGGLFRNLIAANFAENPDLILDLLRNQSEAVLTIAQAGAGKKEPETAPDKKTGTAPESAANISEAEFKKLLVKTLNDDPNLILDVLRAHPEEVLAIAQQGNQERRKKALLRQWEQDAKTPKPFATRNRPMRGAPNAPVLIAAYSDFCCPHCAKASQVIEEYLLSNPTKVHFIFKHRPLASHQHSRIAAQYFIAASMQNDLKAWALYKGMYNGRSELMTRGEAFITELAGKIGLNMERLKADAHGEEALRILEEDIRESKEFGFDGAPYILINNLVLAGAPSPEILDFGVREAMRLK